MTPKIKNIIIFVGIGVVLILVYVFLIKGNSSTDQASLTSTTGNGVVPVSGPVDENSQIAQDFLTLLLNVKGITLNDSIFSDDAFKSLKDSSIELTPDGTEGRPNPFAPIGADTVVSAMPVPVVSTGTDSTIPALLGTGTIAPSTPSKTTTSTTSPKTSLKSSTSTTKPKPKTN